MEPATIASLAGGAGQLLSGLGFGSKKAPAQPTIWEQYNANLWHEQNLFNTKMELAKQHGIHPLSVLGVNTSNYSPVLTTGGQDAGVDFNAMGQGASQIARTFVKPPEEAPDPMAARIMEANVRTAEANAKRAEWEALRSEFAAADTAAPQLLMGQPGSPPGVRTSNDVVQMQGLVAEQSGIPRNYLAGQTEPPVTVNQKVAPPHPTRPGFAAAADQGNQVIFDKNGKPVELVRNEAVQADIEKGATFQALAQIFGIERALQITAVMENEGLLMGGVVAAGYGAKTLYEYIHGRGKGKPNPRQLKSGKWKERR